MGMDPTALLQALQPQIPEIDGETIRLPQAGLLTTPSGRKINPNDITPRPGSSEYLKRIPPSTPMGNEQALSETVSAVPATLVEAAQAALTNVAVVNQHRVAVYCGRGEMFVLAVEDAPDWDASWQGKMDPRTVLALLPVLRALDVRVQDKTGGELYELQATQEGLGPSLSRVADAAQTQPAKQRGRRQAS